MWKIFWYKILEIGEAYKMEYVLRPWWSATLVCALATILNVILLVPNLIYLIWSSWYITKICKGFDVEIAKRS